MALSEHSFLAHGWNPVSDLIFQLIFFLSFNDKHTIQCIYSVKTILYLVTVE